METLTEPKPRRTARKPAQRTARVLGQPEPLAAGVVRLTINGTATDYHVWFIDVAPAIGGVAVGWKKGPNDPEYHVHLADNGATSCTCPGGSYRGKCKHQDATAVLIKTGRLVELPEQA